MKKAFLSTIILSIVAASAIYAEDKDYVERSTLSKPVFSESNAPRSLIEPITFQITVEEPWATIHYTTDSSEPTCQSKLYGNSPVIVTTPNVAKNYVYRAISCMDRMEPSESTMAIYTVRGIMGTQLPEPYFMLHRIDNTSTEIKIIAASGATIHYTLNNGINEPDPAKPTCVTGLSGQSPVILKQQRSVKYKAIACDTGWVDSIVVSYPTAPNWKKR